MRVNWYSVIIALVVMIMKTYIGIIVHIISTTKRITEYSVYSDNQTETTSNIFRPSQIYVQIKIGMALT